MKRSAILFSAVTLFAANAYSQDLVYFNAHQALLDVNPSFAGSNKGLRIQNSYQFKTPSARNNYQTFQNNSDLYIKKLNAGVALQYTNDRTESGSFSGQYFSVSYAQHLKVCDKLEIVPSLKATYLNLTLDYSKLQLGEDRYFRGYDSRYGFVQMRNEPTQYASRQNFDASAGLLIHYNRFYLGGSAFHLNQPDIGLYGNQRLPIKLTFHTSYNFIVKEKTLINVSSRFISQGKYQVLQVAIDGLFFNHLVAGTGMQSSNAIINLGYRNNYGALTATYAGDFSKSSNIPFAFWEISLSLNLRNSANRAKLENMEAW